MSTDSDTKNTRDVPEAEYVVLDQTHAVNDDDAKCTLSLDGGTTFVVKGMYSWVCLQNVVGKKISSVTWRQPESFCMWRTPTLAMPLTLNINVRFKL